MYEEMGRMTKPISPGEMISNHDNVIFNTEMCKKWVCAKLDAK
jgi:hypothetical protein